MKNFYPEAIREQEHYAQNAFNPQNARRSEDNTSDARKFRDYVNKMCASSGIRTPYAA